MSSRTIAPGLGSAVSTFLLAGAATIELLGAGEAPGRGIIGVVGVVAGLLVGGSVRVYAGRFSGIAGSSSVASATFGVVFVAIAGMRSVNIPSADDVFNFSGQIGVSIVVAVVAALSRSWKA